MFVKVHSDADVGGREGRLRVPEGRREVVSIVASGEAYFLVF